MLAADLYRIDSQLLGNLVEVDFQSVPRLRCTMSALWTTRRLVCKRPQSLKLVARHFIRHGLQRPCVERAGDSVTPVCTTIQKRLKVHGRNRAVVFYPRLDSHQHWMAATV